MEPTGSIPQLENIRNSNIADSDARLLSFPATPLPHTMLMVFKDYTYETLGDYNVVNPLKTVGNRSASNVEVRRQSSIELPFPTQLVDNNALNIGSYERNLVAANIADRLKPYMEGSQTTTLQGALNNVGAAGSRAFDGLMSALANPRASAGSAASSIASAAQSALGMNAANAASGAQYLLRSKLDSVLGGEVSRTIDNVTGQTVNPRSTLAFTGVELKTHQFNWELYPSNRDDSDIIRQIVRTIQRNALPGVEDLPGISRAFLKYPAVVDMYLLGIDAEYWMKFKPCMITSFNVDYGGGGLVSIVKGGKPAAVNLSISLTELEIHTTEDYGGSRNTTTASPVTPVRSNESAGPGGNGGV